MRDEHRLEKIEDALDRLRMDAAGQVVIVEGRRDADALEALGIGGSHVLVHRGQALQVWVDEVGRKYAGKVAIVLTDWDRTGGRFARMAMDGLQAHMRVDLLHRRRLQSACRAKCFEDLPAELEALRDKNPKR